MAAKYLILFVVAALGFAQGQQITEVELAPLAVNHISNPLLGHSMSIGKFWLDTQESCHIQFPNGIIYEVNPNQNIPENTFLYTQSVAPFNSCGVAMREISPDLSGSYQLISLTSSYADPTHLTLTRRTFNLVITVSDIVWPN